MALLLVVAPDNASRDVIRGLSLHYRLDIKTPPAKTHTMSEAASEPQSPQAGVSVETRSTTPNAHPPRSRTPRTIPREFAPSFPAVSYRGCALTRKIASLGGLLRSVIWTTRSSGHTLPEPTAAQGGIATTQQYAVGAATTSVKRWLCRHAGSLVNRGETLQSQATIHAQKGWRRARPKMGPPTVC